MQPRLVAHTVIAVMLMAGCDAAGPTVAGPMKLPSTLRPLGEAINYLTNERDVPWTINETHPCQPGESINGSGTAHWIIHTGFDSNGGLHYNATIISKGTGTGTPSGKPYVVNEHFKEVDNAPGNYTGFVIFEQMRLKVDGPSTDFDYYKTTRLKILVNGNGEPTVTVDSESNSCT